MILKHATKFVAAEENHGVKKVQVVLVTGVLDPQLGRWWSCIRPSTKKYDVKMNRKERRLALKSALAYKKKWQLVIVDNLNFDNNKTATAVKILTDLGMKDEKTLIVVKELNDNLILQHEI